MLQQLDESGVGLAVNLQELDLGEMDPFYGRRLVKVAAVMTVYLPERLLILLGGDGLKLEHVADEHHLDPAEWRRIADVVPQGSVDGIDDVAPDHGNLVDDDRIEVAD